MKTGDPVEVKMAKLDDDLSSEKPKVIELWVPATLLDARGDQIAVAFSDGTRTVVHRRVVRVPPWKK